MSDYVPNSSCYERMPHWFVCWGIAGDWVIGQTFETPEPPAGANGFQPYNTQFAVDSPGTPDFGYGVNVLSNKNPSPEYPEQIYIEALPGVPNDILSNYVGGLWGGLFQLGGFGRFYNPEPTPDNKFYTERLASAIVTLDPDNNYSGIDWSYTSNLNKVNLSRGMQHATAKIISQNTSIIPPEGITTNYWYEYSDGFVSESAEETGHGDLYYFFFNDTNYQTGYNILNIGNGGTAYNEGWSAPLCTFKFVDCHTAEFPKAHMQYDVTGSTFGPYTYSKNIQHGHDLVNLVHVEELGNTDDYFPNYAPYPWIEPQFVSGFGLFLTDVVSNFGFDIKLDDQFKL